MYVLYDNVDVRFFELHIRTLELSLFDNYEFHTDACNEYERGDAVVSID